MAKRLIDLQETKGTFQLQGIVTGTSKDNFYKEGNTHSGKAMRRLSFGITYNSDKTLYVSMQGFEQDNVYFSKTVNKETTVDKVPWNDRFTYNREGFRLIGNNIGVTKMMDTNGNYVNDKKYLTDFDACAQISKNLKDGDSVYVRGKIDYSSSFDDNGNKRSYIKFVPTQVSLCTPVNFESEDFKSHNDFNQVIIFMGIEKTEDNRFTVSAKIVTYNSIEDAEFIITDFKLAKLFRNNLKPGNAIKVSGHIVNSVSVEQVNDDDVWGERDSMERIETPIKREFIITGAKPNTLDTQTYSISKIEEANAKIINANKAEKDFGSSNNDWGSLSDIDEDDDMLPWE